MRDSCSRSRRIFDAVAQTRHGTAGSPGASRRSFLASGAKATVVGLAASSGGCTLPTRTVRAGAAPTVTLGLGTYPELERPGGRVAIRSARAGLVYVVHGEDGSAPEHEVGGLARGVAGAAAGDGGGKEEAGEGAEAWHHGVGWIGGRIPPRGGLEPGS